MPPRLRLAVLAASATLVCAGVSLAQNHPDDIYWQDPFVGSGPPNEYTDAIVTHGDELLMGGFFNAVSGMSVRYIARWDGKAWHPLSTGVGSDYMGLVHVIREVEGSVYAGGMFDQLGPWAASSVPRWGNIARYDIATETWLPLGDGTDRAVRGISVAPDGSIYCVGEFSKAGGLLSRGIARWDGSESARCRRRARGTRTGARHRGDR